MSPRTTTRQSLTSVGNLIQKRPILVLSLLVVGVGGFLSWHQSKVQTRLIQVVARSDAEAYSQALATFRTLYTSEVVETVRRQNIPVTHDYMNREGAIPLPATLSMKLGERIGELGSGVHSRLYSPYPLPWRREDGGLRDKFAEDAWKALTADPKKPFLRYEEDNGHWSLRYATADLMRESCVDCHNNHPDTPKNGWQVGDLRGVLEVTLPLDVAAAAARSGLRETLTLFAVFGLVALSAIALVIARLRRSSVELSCKVDERTAKLAQANTQIRTLNEELEQRIAKRTDELAAANTELEAFSYSVSHDLRAPLRSIDGFSLALIEDYGHKLDESGVGHLRRIRAGSQRMAQLINAMLDLARMSQRELQRDSVNLTALARDIVDGLLRGNPQRGAKFIIAERLIATGDSELLRIALENLFENAWKFSEQRCCPTIEFGALKSEKTSAFFVRDNGVGFNMAYADKLFSPFQRLHGANEFQGIGIGLATVHRIIRRHGGTIWAEGSVDQGATFYFTL